MEEEGDDAPTAPFWMATFSDMVTLLLTFFVMIVAMSEVEVKKFKEALSHFQGRTGVLLEEAIKSPSQLQPLAEEMNKASEQGRIEKYQELLEKLAEQNLEHKIQVNLTATGVRVIIADSVMFRSGEATLIEPSRTILKLVAGLVDDDVQSIVVEGHTDDRPISTSRFPSNWELSAARASSVVRFLLEQEEPLLPDRYVAVGYGEYHPVDTNTTPEGRAANRRVEILFSWEIWQNKPNPY